jgi:hypothetical protein
MSNRIVLAMLVIAGVTVAAAVSPLPAAAAATPCWRQVVDDWFDGRIDGTYAPHCYRDALRHLPVDARAYTTAAGDIERALLAAIASRGTVSRPAAASATRAPVGSGVRRLQSRPVGAKPRPAVRPAQSDVKVHDETPIFERAAALGSSGGAARLPLPILVVAVLGGLLLVAAATSRLTHSMRGWPGRT